MPTLQTEYITILEAFARNGPVIPGLDDTIERRRGAKIKANGIYRDPARSSHSSFVKASGLVVADSSWADLSIVRITPTLLGLCSVITLPANLHARKQKFPVQQTAWYRKKLPTFSDALALVKATLFMQYYFPTSFFRPNIRNTQPFHTAYQFPRSLHPFSGISVG
jgi:hypothetical protein